MMVTRTIHSCVRRLPLAVLGVGIALLASGCMFSGVLDAHTGAPIGGAAVTYTDSTGASASTTTDVNGQYSFAQVRLPAPGPVNVRADAPGYEPLTVQVQYDGNPSGFGPVFGLVPTGGGTPSYHNATWGFSMKFPNDWMVVDGQAAQQEGLAVIAVAPPIDVNDKYGETCLVSAGGLPVGMTLETFYQLSMAGLQQETPWLQLSESGAANVNGRQAKRVVASGMNSAYGIEVSSLMYVLVDKQRGFIIMCAVATSRFQNDRANLETIETSFRLD